MVKQEREGRKNERSTMHCWAGRMQLRRMGIDCALPVPALVTLVLVVMMGVLMLYVQPIQRNENY